VTLRTEMRGVVVDVKAHVAGVVANNDGMGSAIVQDLGAGSGCALCSLSLGEYKGTNGDEENEVDGTSVLQERTNDFLEVWRGPYR
jgi:hypothetical protein